MPSAVTAVTLLGTSSGKFVAGQLLRFVVVLDRSVVERDVGKRLGRLQFLALLHFLGRLLRCHGFSPRFGLPPMGGHIAICTCGANIHWEKSLVKGPLECWYWPRRTSGGAAPGDVESVEQINIC
jgi:hypothetical protein